MDALLRRIADLANYTRRRIYPWSLLGLTFVLTFVAAPVRELIGGPGGTPVAIDSAAFWTGGRMVLEGRPELMFDLEGQRAFQHERLHSFYYDEPGRSEYFAPWIAPPPLALLFVPYSMLPFETYGRVVHLSLFVVLYLFGVAWLCRELSLEVSWKHAALAGVTFHPLLMGWFYGQLTALWLVLVVGFVVALRRGRDLRAGVFLGLLAIKPTLAAALVLLMLVRMRVRVLVGVGVGVLLWLVPGLIVLPAQTLGYPFEIGQFWALVRGSGYPTWAGWSVTSFATQLLDGFSEEAASAVGSALALAIGVVLAFRWRRVPWRPGAASFDLGLAGVLVLGPLLGPHLHLYDLGLFVVPALLVAAACQAWVAEEEALGLENATPERRARAERRTDYGAFDGGPYLALVSLVWTLGLLAPYFALLQRVLTRRLFDVPIALHVGVPVLVLAGLKMQRDAQRAAGSVDPSAAGAGDATTPAPLPDQSDATRRA